MSSIRTAGLAAALIAWGAGTALGAPSTLHLVIGGEAYDGPPRFEVTFDGQALGEAAVDAAIDTGSAGRFADAADRSAHVQSFSFEVPEALFRPDAEVRIRLINEAFGGEGSNRDRNLYLASVAVNGRAVTVSGLATQGTATATENELLGEFLVLRDGTMEGVSRAPTGGWPLPGAAVAVSAPVPGEPAPVVAPTAPAAVTLPVSPEITGTVETASLERTPPAADGACTRDELYNVVGFNENSNDLTPRLEARLDQIIADIGTEKCRVLVTGYSSRQGSLATNALYAVERAQNVLGYLRKSGVAFEKAIAAGGGATDQFGPSSSANRRVVITVTP